MYRKRNQLMEIAVCLADACAALFSLCVAGVLRYQTLEGLAQAENIRTLLQHHPGHPRGRVLLYESL